MDPFFGQQIPAEGNLDLHRSAFRAPGFGSLQKKSPPSPPPPSCDEDSWILYFSGEELHSGQAQKGTTYEASGRH